MNQTLLAAICAGFVGTVFLQRYPFPDGEFLVQLTAAVNPYLYLALKWSWCAMLYTTPMLCFLGVFSFVYIFTGEGRRQPKGELPLFPEACDNDALHVVLGEVHHQSRVEPVDDPHWLIVPERGLFTGIAVFGAIGSGKTSGAVKPFASQVLRWRRKDEQRRVGGIVLEVKGDFCHQVKDILEDAGRSEDYVELNMDGEYRYNPLYSQQDAFALAYSIASVMNQLYGKGKEPFWQQAYTNLMKFIIILHKVVDGYVTLFNVYECAINPDRLTEKLEEGEQMFKRCPCERSTLAAAKRSDYQCCQDAGVVDADGVVIKTDIHETYVVIDPMLYHMASSALHAKLSRFAWASSADGMRTAVSDELLAVLDSESAPYRLEVPEEVDHPEGFNLLALAQFEAFKRWLVHDWMRMKPDLRTSIVEGLSVVVSMFDENAELKRVFCPPKETYTDPSGAFGKPLPPIRELIESGRVLALNFPLSTNPAIARMISCLVKQEYQRAMIDRIPMMARHRDRHFRESMFLCDEYHELATVGESDPYGDDKFFALSRQAKCIPIVATQSISSLRSALPGESWRTLLQCFRTKLFLACGDEFTAKSASDMAGRTEQLVPSYSISESGQDVRASALTGRTTSHKAGVTLNKNYSLQTKPLFEPKVLMELGNAQCVAIAYDGSNPLPPTMLLLKPYHLDREMSYFEQRQRRLL